MSPVLSELASVGFFLAVGWAALWPARARLGAWLYQLASLPVGLLAAPLAGAFSTVTGRPLDLLSAGAGAAVLITAARLLLRDVQRAAGAQPKATGLSGLAVAAGSVGMCAAVLSFARFTVSNYDSIVSYWPRGLELARHGAFTERLLASRNALLPSMNAIHASFGSDWAYVVYPVMGASLVLWTAATLLRGPLRGAEPKTRGLVAGGAAVFLIVEPSVIFHSFFVHSHMVSALYILMALSCLWLAARDVQAWDDTTGEVSARPFLVLAGTFTAGLALARPDGLAYQFVIVAAAISVLTMSRVSLRRVIDYFGPLLFIEIAVFGAAFFKLGVWESNKLSGSVAVAILLLLIASAGASWIVWMLDRVLPFRVAGESFLGVLVAFAGVVAVALYALRWETASLALANARINLFEGAGGYSYLWYALGGLLLLTLFSGDAVRGASWTRPAFLAAALFIIVAGVIHGTSHAGRIGVGDSLNRVVFHIVPVIVWYAAAVVGRVLTSGGSSATGGEQV